MADGMRNLDLLERKLDGKDTRPVEAVRHILGKMFATQLVTYSVTNHKAGCGCHIEPVAGSYICKGHQHPFTDEDCGREPRPELPSRETLAEMLLGEWLAVGEPCVLRPDVKEAWLRVADAVLSLLRGGEGEK
jgi:hypothetical protein